MVGRYRKFGNRYYVLSNQYQTKSAARNSANVVRSKDMNARVIPTSKGYAVYVQASLIRRSPSNGRSEGNLYLKQMPKKVKLGKWGERFADMKISGFTNKQLNMVDRVLDSSSCYGSNRISESAKRQLDLVKSTPKNQLFERKKGNYLKDRESDIRRSYPDFYVYAKQTGAIDFDYYSKDGSKNLEHTRKMRTMAFEYNQQQNENLAKKLGYGSYAELGEVRRQIMSLSETAGERIGFSAADAIIKNNTKNELQSQIDMLEEQIRFNQGR